MELFITQSRYEHFGLLFNNTNQQTTSTTMQTAPPPTVATTTHAEQFKYDIVNSTQATQDLKQDNYNNETFIHFVTNTSNDFFSNSLLLGNTSDFGDIYGNWSNSSLEFNSSDTTDGNLTLLQPNDIDDYGTWGYCLEWTAAQHTLFQTANLFFAAAFLVPPTFKQSVLLTRFLLSIGFFFSTFWGGMEICAPDILLWNLMLALLNTLHALVLTWRFLPPALTLELTELYLKVFKPLRVSKKHFKELTREATVMRLEKGDIYAVEDVSAADERLSILLKGKLRVTCDDTHLHFINTHQFIDSPEWESNHEQSDDVFQVTISAEEDSVYLCWPRMRLERVLRHRPMLKIVLDSIIGKDITQKLYSLNEHLLATAAGVKNSNNEAESIANNLLFARSLSVDAVHTGTRGRVRSTTWKMQYPTGTPSHEYSPLRQNVQCWVPIVASHFPPTSPFTHIRTYTMHTTPPSVPLVTGSSTSNEFTYPSTDGLLNVPQQTPPIIERKKSFRSSFRRNRETKSQVKFQKEVQEVSYDALRIT